MCGRFTLRTNPQQLALKFACDIPETLEPRWNIAPTQAVAAVRPAESGGRVLALLRWGLVPHWAEEISIGNRMINARAETVAEKPAFRAAFRRRRCLVLADGYFEWKKTGATKQPFFIRLRDEQPFAFAGLWESWRDPQQEQPLLTCTILTTAANQLTQPIHDRMPVILPEDAYALWLAAQTQDPETLVPLLRPFDSQAMVADPVDTWVNNPRHDDPRCVRIQT